MMQAIHGHKQSHAVKRKVLSSGEDSSPAKRNHAVIRSSSSSSSNSSSHFVPPALSPASVTITTSNGEKIELVGDPSEGRSPYEDYGYPEESSGGGSLSLLPCRVRRNYACKLCDYTSINPRQFLYHQRDSHGQKGNIHECSYCMYASVHSHKLLRHISLVHRHSGTNTVEDHEQLRTSAGYVASPPPPLPPSTSVSAIATQNLSSSSGGSAVATMTSTSSPYHHNLSGDGVPLPPDLEVILVEEEDSAQTQNGPGARKSVRPMLLEPSVVLLPLDKQKNFNNNNTNNKNNNSGSNGIGPYDKAQRPPPPPLLHRQNIRPPPPLQNSPFQTNSLPPPPRLASIRPADPRVSNPAASGPVPLPLSTTATDFSSGQRAKVVQEFSCSKCNFKSKSQVLVQRHEKVSHLKRKFFRCTKCNYVTNVRARFTKHVRYHDMPYIKCELCDFSTPYKWNLDRHRRNHQEEGALMGTAPEGVEVFRCHRCSFSTLSKQSLSVHLLNHHAEGGGQKRPRKMDENGQELGSPDSFVIDGEDDGEYHHAFQHENGFMGMLEGEDEEEEEDDNEELDDEELGDDEDEDVDEDDMEDLEALEEEDGNIHTDDEGGQYGEEDDAIPEDELDGPSKPYACAECRESFASVSHLDRHVYECHEVDRPKGGSGPPESGQRTPTPKTGDCGSKTKFKCDLCPYQAKWISEVVRHRRVHVSDKPFACPHCYFRSKWKGDMTRHVSKYHGGLLPGMSMRSRDDDAMSLVKSAAVGDEQDTEVDDIDQLLDQSMMVGGEEELHLFDERNNNSNANMSSINNNNRQHPHNHPHHRRQHIEHQDGPLDLSRPVGGYDYLTKEILQKYNKERDGATGLLPYLLKMPPRQPFTQSRLTAAAPIHLSPSVQLIPTSGSSAILGPSSVVGSGMQTIVTSAPISTTAVQSTTTLHTTTSPSCRNDQSVSETLALAAADAVVKPGERSQNSPIVRKLYQCPYCKYSTTTASRFHMHVVVHLNQKPYMCSECGYRSNWQWDVTKHAKVKASRDPSHKRASVVLVNEVGAKNYEKYEKYAVYETISKSGRRSYATEDPTGAAMRNSGSEEFDHPMFVERGMSPSPSRRPALPPSIPKSRIVKKITYKCKYCEFRNSARRTIIRHMSVHSSNKPFWCGICGQSSNCRNVILRHCQVRHGVPGPIMQRDEEAENPPLPSAPGVNGDLGFEVEEESVDDISKQNSSSALVHCLTGSPQLSSPTAKSGEGTESETSSIQGGTLDAKEDKSKRHKCPICPYRCRKLFDLRIHSYMHKPHEGAIFKCMFCPFYVSLKRSWLQHMKLHVDQPQEFARQYLENGAEFEAGDKKSEGGPAITTGNTPTSTAEDGPKSPPPEDDATMLTTSSMPEASRSRPPRPKRYVCEQCPYKTGSHTTFLYHRQFHRPGRVGVHRCTHCSYSVTRPHLLGQHIRMHEAYDAEMKKRKESGVKDDSSPEMPSTPSRAATSTRPSNTKSPSQQGPPPLAVTATSVMTSSGTIGNSTPAASAPKACTPPPPSQFSPEEGPPPPGEDLPYELAGISRVWVSRNGVFLKMFRCRHCPHVSKKRAVIIAHERLHYKRKMTAGKQIFKCQLCNYTCKNAGILSSHQKVHRAQQSMVMINDGTVSSVGPAGSGPSSSFSRPVIDASSGSSPQLAPSKLSQEKFHNNNNNTAEPLSPSLGAPSRSADVDGGKEGIDKWTKPSSTRFPNKLYSSCGLCPAKFMKPHQVALHRTFHGANLAWQCQYCSYSARHRPHLHNHLRVHTDEYQKEFKREFGGSPIGIMDKQNDENISSLNRLKSAEFTNTTAATTTTTSDNILHSTLSTPQQTTTTTPAASAVVPPSKQASSSKTPGSQSERKHRCHLCPAIFIKYSTLVYHLHLHGSNSKFKCPHCTYSVTNIGNLVRHVKVHDAGNQNLAVNETDACSNNSASPSSVGGGGAKLHGIFACPKCPAMFDKQLRFDVHLGLHGSKQRFQCDHCDYSVQYAANLVRHRRMHAAHEANQKMAAASASRLTSDTSLTTTTTNSTMTPGTTMDSYTTTSITNSYALNGGTVVEASSSSSNGGASVAPLFDNTLPAGVSSGSKSLVLPHNKSVGDLLGETLNSMEGANITPVEKQQLLLQRLQSLQVRNQTATSMTSTATRSGAQATTPTASVEPEQSLEPKKLFRCGRCPYTHPRKDAVQSHMKRHAISDSSCPHCDYGSSLTSFLREHIKLHFKPLRIHQVEAFVQWEEFEVWAKYGDLRRLIYRYSVDGKEFTEDDVYEVTNEEFLAKQKMRNGEQDGGEPDITIIGQKDVGDPRSLPASSPLSPQLETEEQQTGSPRQNGGGRTEAEIGKGEMEVTCSKGVEKEGMGKDIEEQINNVEDQERSRDEAIDGELPGEFEEKEERLVVVVTDDHIASPPSLGNVVGGAPAVTDPVGEKEVENIIGDGGQDPKIVDDDEILEEMEVEEAKSVDSCSSLPLVMGEDVHIRDVENEVRDTEVTCLMDDGKDDESSRTSSDTVMQVLNDLLDEVQEHQSRDADVVDDNVNNCTNQETLPDKVSDEVKDEVGADEDEDDDVGSVLGDKWIVLDEHMDDEEEEEEAPLKENSPGDLPNGFVEQSDSTSSSTNSRENCASQAVLKKDSDNVEGGDGSSLKVSTDVPFEVEDE